MKKGRRIKTRHATGTPILNLPYYPNHEKHTH